MTDQPYTPTTEEIREYVEMGGEPRPWEPPTPEGEALEIKRREAFDRWLAAHDAAIEAAAEQRGEKRAFKESANEVRREMRWQYEQNINRNSDTGDSIDRLLELEKVFKYRADQIGAQDG